MKKKILLITIFFIMIISLWNSICYADVVIDNSDYENKMMSICFISGVLFFILLISYFILKTSEDDNETPENNIKKLSKLKLLCYVLGIIFIFNLLAVYSVLNLIYNADMALILLFLLLLLIIAKIINKKRLTTIMLIITIAYIIMIPISSIILQNKEKSYNEKFAKYFYHYPYAGGVDDIEGLINEIIANNKLEGRKITLIYEEKEYATPEELKRLLSRINKNKYYYTTIKFDEKYHYIVIIKIENY